MAKGAIHTLALRQGNCIFIDCRKNIFIASEKIIFAKENIAIAPIPHEHAILEFELQCFRTNLMGKSFNPWQILGIACCHQSQAVNSAPHIIAERFVFEHLACFIKNEFRLRAVKRSSCRVGTHDPKFELHFFGFALSPNEKV